MSNCCPPLHHRDHGFTYLTSCQPCVDFKARYDRLDAIEERGACHRGKRSIAVACRSTRRHCGVLASCPSRGKPYNRWGEARDKDNSRSLTAFRPLLVLTRWRDVMVQAHLSMRTSTDQVQTYTEANAIKEAARGKEKGRLHGRNITTLWFTLTFGASTSEAEVLPQYCFFPKCTYFILSKTDNI